MARSVNKVILIGNVGQDPDVRTTPSGTRVAKVSLATNRRFKDRAGEFQEDTQWHRLTMFSRIADVVEQWVKKGDMLYVEGRLRYSQSQDQQGVTRYWTDIVVDQMTMLGTRGGSPESSDMGTGGGGSRGAPAPKPDLDDPDDDLPF